MTLAPPRRRLLRRLPALLTAAALATTVLAACSSSGAGGSATTTAGADGGTLKWASSYAPTSWDPVVNGSGASFRITGLAYASLTNINAKGEAVPGLASSWKYNGDGTEVTFHLRNGLTFDDGSALDASAVKAYFVDPVSGAPRTDNILKVAGGIVGAVALFVLVRKVAS